MKRSLFYAVLAVLMLPTLAFSPVEENLQARTKVIEDAKVQVQLYNLQQQRTTLAITDLDEEVSYYKTTISRHNGFAKILDVSELSNGRYLLKVNNGSTTLKEIMKVDDNRILLSGFSE